MASTSFARLLRRTTSSKTFPKCLLFRLPQPTKPFSTTSIETTPVAEEPTTLSDRLSFVFDQMDAIKRDRGEKDEALQRIRSWREKKRQQQEEVQQKSFPETSAPADPVPPEAAAAAVVETSKEVELVHPWPEWIELMERLVRQNYFHYGVMDGDLAMVADGKPFDITRDWNAVRTACLNFGRDRFDILRYLSRQDIQNLVGHGCPNLTTHVVFSAKLLRKYVRLDEGDVCSSCNLRSSCERGYLVPRKEEEARTLDIMRILLTYGFDHINGTVQNKPIMKKKSVRTAIQKLLQEVVKLSAVPIDPSLPPPIIKKPPPKVKQPPPPPRKRVGRDDIEMKKGDWLCTKCDFMNFAKNVICLQCDSKRPKRELLPGEWECPKCNFLNYRRNMACFHCDCKRPPDEFTEHHMQAKPRVAPRPGLERATRMPNVSDAWNFDFDENESDGADVAAFEFADSARKDNECPIEEYEDIDSHESRRLQRIQGRGRNYTEPDEKEPSVHSRRTGFDDFDDEDDDIDSYEIDLPSKDSRQEAYQRTSSEIKRSSEFEDLDDYAGTHNRTDSRSFNGSSRRMPGRASYSGSEDDDLDFGSDTELPVHPNWKSSHITDSRQGMRTGGGRVSYGTDDDLMLNSDSDDDMDQGSRHKQKRRHMQHASVRNKRGFDSENDFSFDSESDDEDFQSQRNKLRGIKSRFGGRGNASMGHNQSDSQSGELFRSNDRMRGGFGERGNTSMGHNQSDSQRGGHFRSNDRMRGKMNSSGDRYAERSLRGPKRDNYASHGSGSGGRVNNRQGGFPGFDRRKGWDRSGFRQ
ncbi:hypothetical protein QJS10_CPB04g00322 [Acorus calamus]|uniref:RanBP2-type domain-containing protein n=1 Tax=Acorus calamus TaxID=4465 RepID=A0AAV9EXB3_ACOCL|nr:hypothetical protein QJS10_CPB04g00322 [Acorus calamus]